MFSIEGCPHYSGDFVLATLLDSGENGVEQKSTSSVKSQLERDLSVSVGASLANKPRPKTDRSRESSQLIGSKPSLGQNHERDKSASQAGNKATAMDQMEFETIDVDCPGYGSLPHMHGSGSHVHESLSHVHGSQSFRPGERVVVPETVARTAAGDEGTAIIDGSSVVTAADHEFMEGLFELDDDDDLVEVPKGGSVFGFVKKPPHETEQPSISQALSKADTINVPSPPFQPSSPICLDDDSNNGRNQDSMVDTSSFIPATPPKKKVSEPLALKTS